MANEAMHYKDQLEDYCKAAHVEGIIRVLTSQATSHAGTARAQVKNYAIRSLKNHHKRNAQKLYTVAVDLCLSDNNSAQEVGVIILADFFGDHEHEVERILHTLANAENWEVREWVASACGRILAQQFSLFYPVMGSWAQDESEKLRRAVALALMYAGKTRNPNYTDRILDLIEALLADRSPYVRDNLGPFALGAGLIKYYPEPVMARLREWVRSENEQVRWNVAMVFSAAEGAKHAPTAKIVIDILRRDESPYVKRAVAKAVQTITKRYPDFF